MLGTLLGERYKIITVLGVGGFGQTYLAEDLQQPEHSPCVVKQFKPASQDSKFLEVARRLFNTEAQILKRLGQHDQIPTFFNAFEDEREFYLVQEFVDGISLADEIGQRRFSESEVIELLKDVLGILDFVHNQRVIHRDIKPGNLIRRQRDGKIVLIDFGAVKELQTQILGESGQTGFTVGIGTQGYTPGEQLAGKPRFASDIYALGVTAVQALIRMSPSQLPEDPNTSELLWQGYVPLSPGLSLILDRMVRYHFSQRFQSAGDVLQALQKLSELPTDMTDVPPSMLLPESLQQQLLMKPEETWHSFFRAGVRSVAIATILVMGVVLGVRQMGLIEPLERAVYDRMVRLTNTRETPDPRLLIVTITEADLQALDRSTPNDESVATVLQTLNQYDPSVIGLDLHRDLPQEPGHQQLLQQLQSPNVIPILKLGTDSSDRIPPPVGVPPERVGFSDLPIDADGIVRRNLMFADTEANSFYSFSLRLALHYLAERGIELQASAVNPEYPQLGNVIFQHLEKDSGGYQTVDDAGYQILLQYHSAQNVARQVSFTDVLNGQIDPSWVRDKVVLIGTTAPSAKDLFYTPYSAGQQSEHQMPGVVLHAQMVSQILTAVLEGRSLFWFWSEWVEVLWIAGWAATGGLIAWFVKNPVVLAGGGVLVIIGIVGSGVVLFTQQGWIPVAAPAIATIITGGMIVAYRSYRMQQRQQQMITQLLQPSHSPTMTLPRDPSNS